MDSTSALEPFSVHHWWLTYAAYEASKEERMDLTRKLVVDLQRHVVVNVVGWIV